MKRIKVAVIGSGLSSLGGLKGLCELGLTPTVFDKGDLLPKSNQKLISYMSSVEPNLWTKKQIGELTKNKFIQDKKYSIPKKIIFGSDYAYGKSSKYFPLKSFGISPPFSFAKGGFSTIWGSASLPPAKEDVSDWPLKHREIIKYYKKVLKDIPYTAKNDSLSMNFNISKSKFTSLKLNETEKTILKKISESRLLKKNNFLFGNSRLLVDSSNGENGCRYCGNCMSGCVYNSIFSTEKEIDKLNQQKKIIYLGGSFVTKIFENKNKVYVEYIKNKKKFTKKFDKVFLAAGALSTSRIIMTSYSDSKPKFLKTRGGFLVPIFSFKKIKHELPYTNTLPKIFFEIKNPFDNHWVHIQLSVTNELFIKKLESLNNSIFKYFKKFLFDHIMFAFINLHSSNSSAYKITVSGNNDFPILKTEWIKSYPKIISLAFVFFKLVTICSKFYSLPIFPFLKFNSGTYHIGSSFPMKKNPKNFFETDRYGRLSKSKAIHIIDTSIFPSLPGTTVGLLAMSNAYRIVKTMNWDL